MANYSTVLNDRLTAIGASTIAESYDSAGALPTLLLTDIGEIAYTSNNGKLNAWNGTSWNTVGIVNTAPTVSSTSDADLASDGTPTVITFYDSDAEDVPLTWSYSVTSGSLGGTTVSVSGSTFTITPSTNSADAGSFTLSFIATDGINQASTSASYSLAFGVNWTTATLVRTLSNPNAYGTSANDSFGNIVYMKGDYAFIGVEFEDDAGGTESGKLYIFNVTNGTLVKTLNNPNGYGTTANDRFTGYPAAGSSPIAVHNNYLAVGAPLEDDAGGTESGKAYIFETTTGDWSDTTLIRTLNNPNAFGTSTSDYFGRSLALFGNYCAVAAAYEDDTGTDINSVGRVYIFNVTTGALITTLNDPNPYGTKANDRFGDSNMYMDDSYLIVAAIGEGDASGTSSGKVYIFKTTTGDWTDAALIKTLDNPNAENTSANNLFGQKLAVSGNYLIVGVPNEHVSGLYNSGTVYIFKTTTGDWTDTALLHTIINPDDDGNAGADEFGYLIAASGDFATITAFRENDTNGTQSGKAYIYDLTTGTLVKTLYNPNAYGTSANDFFSQPAMDQDYILIGAPQEDEAGALGSGKVYVFQAS